MRALRRLFPGVDARAVILAEATLLPLGFVMNALGHALGIAGFRHGWQVLTCYGLYLVPVCLALRGRPLLQQYAFGVMALAPCELLGYAIGTSIAYEGNLIDAVLGPRNFTLAMTIFFGALPAAGARLIDWLEARLWPVRRIARWG